jgi:CspA family cold shock protein
MGCLSAAAHRWRLYRIIFQATDLKASAPLWDTEDCRGGPDRLDVDCAEKTMYGTVKKIVKEKGFGFIIPDDGGDEVFFHRSRLSPKLYFEDLREGSEVQFDVKPGEKGRQAFNVRLR